MKKVYGDDCQSRARVHELFTRFRDGREDINDDEHTGRPKSVFTENSIEILREFIKNEPKSSLKFMESELNISIGVCCIAFVEVGLNTAKEEAGAYCMIMHHLIDPLL